MPLRCRPYPQRYKSVVHFAVDFGALARVFNPNNDGERPNRRVLPAPLFIGSNGESIVMSAIFRSVDSPLSDIMLNSSARSFSYAKLKAKFIGSICFRTVNRWRWLLNFIVFCNGHRRDDVIPRNITPKYAPLERCSKYLSSPHR